jgi:hypothetical protein
MSKPRSDPAPPPSTCSRAGKDATLSPTTEQLVRATTATTTNDAPAGRPAPRSTRSQVIEMAMVPDSRAPLLPIPTSMPCDQHDRKRSRSQRRRLSHARSPQAPLPPPPTVMEVVVDYGCSHHPSGAVTPVVIRLVNFSNKFAEGSAVNHVFLPGASREQKKGNG